MTARPFDPARAHRRLARLWARVPDGHPGAHWYRDEARAVFVAADAAGVDRHRALAALAILSPATRWEPLRDAFLAGLGQWARTGLAPRLPAYGRNVAKAGAVLTGRLDPWAAATGPKVQAFLDNLAGVTEPVTVDRWAWTLATGDRSGAPAGAAQYRACAAVYAVLARDVGLAPCEVQAALWTRFRRTARARRRIRESP